MAVRRLIPEKWLTFEHRGIRFALRTGIVRRQWRVVVYIRENEPIERTMKGSRWEAEAVVRGMIDKLLDPATSELTDK